MRSSTGFVNIVGLHLFNTFLDNFEYLKLRILGNACRSTHKTCYCSTLLWFYLVAIGVATEYIKDSEVVKDGLLQTVPSLSDTKIKLVDGTVLEEDFTSGGVADLPFALAGQVEISTTKHLDIPVTMVG